MFNNDDLDYREIAHDIEKKWRSYWEKRGTYVTSNPGDAGFDASKPKYVILDFFPYPSGVGLHVGHPLGYVATDVKARFMRMRGHNVLHSMGFDSFGLPAEQFAIQTGQHPRITTEANISNMLSQLSLLGLGHDPHRRFSTSDPEYYRWTQWIFLQLYNSFYDPTVRWTGPNGHENVGRARPIRELPNLLLTGSWMLTPDGKAIPSPGPGTQKELPSEKIDTAVEHARLAFLDEVDVNWCPALGTVLSNEEVTNEGRSERGDHPVYRRPLRQWMLRITEYADRLIADLARVNWPAGTKDMQLNWIGRSDGVDISFSIAGSSECITVFTTRPETLGGVTFLALTPTHPFVDLLTTAEHSAAIQQRRNQTFEARQAAAEERIKLGEFTGSFAVNPLTGEPVPVWVADYVLSEYGTGAVMGVPAHDQRDFEFACAHRLSVKAVMAPPVEWLTLHCPHPACGTLQHYIQDPGSFGEPYTGTGPLLSTQSCDLMVEGAPVSIGEQDIIRWLEANHRGSRRVRYKLKDWLFSRQRYWGEPFPIVFDRSGKSYPLSVNTLPLELPDLSDFQPVASDDPESKPVPPLAKAVEWAQIQGVILADGSVRPLKERTDRTEMMIDGFNYKVHDFRRELNTMPNWAGSCWYYLRYFDPKNSTAFVAADVESYWSLGTAGSQQEGSIDMYVGGAEHAVLHLLYARFWHKVLYDLGYVSTHEPFDILVNQGMITADAFRDARGVYHEASEVLVKDIGANRRAFHRRSGQELEIVIGKMGKRYKNGVAPEDVCSEFSVDTFRLYEMYLGPLDIDKPWRTAAVVGMMRFLASVWRNVIRVMQDSDGTSSAKTTALVHQTIVKVTDDIQNFRLNTAIAALIMLNRELSREPRPSRSHVLILGLMLSPFAPHLGEEIASRLAPAEHSRWGTVLKFPWPVADPAKMQVSSKEIAVTIDGKRRGSFIAAVDASDRELEDTAKALEPVQRILGGLQIRRVILVRTRNLINFVTNSRSRSST